MVRMSVSGFGILMYMREMFFYYAKILPRDSKISQSSFD